MTIAGAADPEIGITGDGEIGIKRNIVEDGEEGTEWLGCNDGFSIVSCGRRRNCWKNHFLSSDRHIGGVRQ